jgi:hypothetical protein
LSALPIIVYVFECNNGVILISMRIQMAAKKLHKDGEKISKNTVQYTNNTGLHCIAYKAGVNSCIVGEPRRE